MAKIAIILGATGLTGSLLTNNLISDSRFDKIKLFTRRATGFEHPKIEEIHCDLLNLEAHKEQFIGDVVFCCIGTTKAKTPDRDMYHKIDYGIPLEAIHLCKTNNIETFMVISSIGVSPKSRFFYVRTKGEMERDVLKVGIKNTFLMKPAFIDGRKKEDRKGESRLQFLMHLIDFFMIGPLKKYRSIQSQQIANAMVYLSHYPTNKHYILNPFIKELSKRYES